MNRWITACVLWMAASAGFYCLAMNGALPAVKYYPKVNEFHFYQKPDMIADVEKDPVLKQGSTKFSNTAVFGMVVCLPALLIGWAIGHWRPVAMAVHLAGWGVLIVTGVVMFLREMHRFGPPGG